MTNYLLDTNLLLRSVDPGSPRFRRARFVINTLLARGDQLFITAQNLVELWAVATRPIDANGLGWNAQKTRYQIEELLDQFAFLDETSEAFAYWLQLVTEKGITGRRVHDARLVAVMMVHGVSHLLTFNDVDFQVFDDIAVVNPEEVQ